MRLKSIKIQNHLKSITVISIIVPMLLLFIFFISPTFGQQTVKTGGDSESLNAKRQAVIIDSVTSALNDIYVFPEVAKKMENLLRKNLKKGIYKKITDLPEFTEQLTKDLQAVSKDKHLRVRALPPKPQGESTQPSPEEERKERLKRLQYQNFGFKKVELLPGNIGYIDFRFFADATLGGATAIAAMNFLSHADAIIFDLRQNGGGSP